MKSIEKLGLFFILVGLNGLSNPPDSQAGDLIMMVVTLIGCALFFNELDEE